MISKVSESDSTYNIFYKNYFEVVIDSLNFTRLYTNAIKFNKLSKSCKVTMYVNEDILPWINSLQKSQVINMKYTLCSPNGSYKSVIYDGNAVVDDVVYSCKVLNENDVDKALLIDIELSICDKKVVNS